MFDHAAIDAKRRRLRQSSLHPELARAARDAHADMLVAFDQAVKAGVVGIEDHRLRRAVDTATDRYRHALTVLLEA